MAFQNRCEIARLFRFSCSKELPIGAYANDYQRHVYPEGDLILTFAAGRYTITVYTL